MNYNTNIMIDEISSNNNYKLDILNSKLSSYSELPENEVLKLNLKKIYTVSEYLNSQIIKQNHNKEFDSFIKRLLLKCSAITEYCIFLDKLYVTDADKLYNALLIINQLRNKKWKFSGVVNYKKKNRVRFELKYKSKESSNYFLFTGRSRLGEELIFSSINIHYYVCNEEGEYCDEYYTKDIDHIEAYTTLILDIIHNTKSYGYFIEYYNRYVKNDCIEYIKSLIHKKDLILQKVYSDKRQSRYQGEFLGEEVIEITIGNAEKDLKIKRLYTDKIIEDSVKISVSGIFELFYVQEYSDDLRCIIQGCEKNEISVEDFLVRTTTRFCVKNNHKLESIKAYVNIDNGISITKYDTWALYCEDCDRYYIRESDYLHLKRIGRICCKVIEYEEYQQMQIGGYNNWASKSILRSYGYTVNSIFGLSDKERQRILSFIIENKIMKLTEVIDFIEWLVKKDKGEKYVNANLKRRKDLDYLKNYTPAKDVCIIGSITYKHSKNSIT